MTFESSLSKGLNVLAIFRSVDKKKSRCLARGRQERNSLLPGLLFRKINILVESWKSVEKRKNGCENFTRKDILSCKECLDNGNLWFLPFSFRWLRSHVFLNRKSNFNLIIFKCFGVCWRGSKRNASLGSWVWTLCGIADSAYWFATVTLLLQF